MSLDFTVLGQNGAPDKMISLGVDLHYELVTTAATLGLDRFSDFADYYEDVEIVAEELPGLGEQIRELNAQTGSVKLRRFLNALTDLVDYAIAKGVSLHAIAD
jgi:hypothetical protein